MSVQHVEVAQHDVGQRLDNFLLRVLKGVPRQHVYKIIRSGEVRINSGRSKATYRLRLGDNVRIPPVRTRAEVPVKPAETFIARLQAAVLFENDDYLIIDKPAGFAVHGGSSIASGVVEQLRLAYANDKLALIHRLDRDTSGCLALAKNRQALQTAQLAFRERRVGKIYRALVWGQWPRQLRTAHEHLTRYTTASGERRVRVDANGQAARSDFAIVEAGTHSTDIQITLHTGRTHQIRVHCRHHGHGILGDAKYGLDDNVPRLCLHAYKLHLPMGDQVTKIVAPLPAEWRQLHAAAEASPAVR